MTLKAKTNVRRNAGKIPVIAEELEIERARRVTGVVRVEKAVELSEAKIDERLLVETVRVERRAIEPARPVDAAPPIRQEGDVTIVPVVEERLVVSRLLVVVEEIHITRDRRERRAQETVTLRRERVSVERVAPGEPSESANADRGGDPTP